MSWGGSGGLTHPHSPGADLVRSGGEEVLQLQGSVATLDDLGEHAVGGGGHKVRSPLTHKCVTHGHSGSWLEPGPHEGQ